VPDFIPGAFLKFSIFRIPFSISFEPTSTGCGKRPDFTLGA
jgi:hypothetical protein